MNLSDKVQDYIKKQDPGTPILASDIVEMMLPVPYTEEEEKRIRQNVYVILARMLQKRNGFQRYSSGIYYRVDENNPEIATEELIERLFLKDNQGNVTGYVTGESFAYQLGFIEDAPSVVQISSNNWRKQANEDSLAIEITAPPRYVTDQNMLILQFLDLLKWDLSLTLKERNCRKLASYIYETEMDPLEVMTIAVRFYSQKVILSAAKLAPYYLKIRQQATAESTF